jgi:hypothetical protein
MYGGYGGQPGMPGSPGAEAVEVEPPTLAEEADRAMSEGYERAAFDLLYASLLTEDNSDVLKKYKWVDGLKRPVLAVRWGIGLEVTLPERFSGEYYPVGTDQSLPERTSWRNRRGQQGRGGRSGAPGGSRPGTGSRGPGSMTPGMGPGMPGGMGNNRAGAAVDPSQELVTITGDLGQRLLAHLEEKIREGDYGRVLADFSEGAASPNSGMRRGAGGYPGGMMPGRGMGPGVGMGPGAGMGPTMGPNTPGMMSGPPAGMMGPPGMDNRGMGPRGGGMPGYPGRGAAANVQAPPQRVFHKNSDVLSLLPGISMLGQGTADELLELAKSEGIDVLVVFEVEIDERLRTEMVVNETRLRVIDVQKEKDLHRTKKINNVYVQRQLEEEKDNPVDEVYEELFEALDEDPETNLKVRAFPSGIKPEHVKQRVVDVVVNAGENRLPVLAEVKFYKERDLIDDTVLIKASQKLVGEVDGVTLIEGDEEERLAVADELLEKSNDL